MISANCVMRVAPARRSAQGHTSHLLATLPEKIRCASSQFAMLKNNFGTIRGCERAVDVFFHFDALDDGLAPADLAVGDDVEFSVQKDAVTKKVAAVRCALRCTHRRTEICACRHMSELRHSGAVCNQQRCLHETPVRALMLLTPSQYRQVLYLGSSCGPDHGSC